MSDKPQAVPATVIRNRLSPEVYAALEKDTQGRLPAVPRTDGEAHFAAGVELVLRKLRAGFVVGP